MLTEYITAVQEGRELTRPEVARVVSLLADAAQPVEDKASFLACLAAKGETTAEIAAFAEELRGLSIRLPWDASEAAGEVLDVCGTGGDRLDTFNISTTVALVCAAAGVTVAKHGNRAVTSKSGSADVLEALGIPVDLAPDEAARSLREHRFVFLFAPRFHPAFRNIAPARALCAQRGQRTLFNFLGPLLNPARPTAQLVGVPRPALVEPMARTLQQLGVRRAMVVSGSVPGGGYLDELSTLGDNAVAEFYQDRGFSTSTWSARPFPLLPATLEDLKGGDSRDNAVLLAGLLRGDDAGPRRDAVLLNAGAALFVAGVARSIMEGWERAADVLASGAAWRLVESLRTRRP
jgi:anthranilate phosphoribosyltransferase